MDSDWKISNMRDQSSRAYLWSGKTTVYEALVGPFETALLPSTYTDTLKTSPFKLIANEIFRRSNELNSYKYYGKRLLQKENDLKSWKEIGP